MVLNFSVSRLGRSLAGVVFVTAASPFLPTATGESVRSVGAMTFVDADTVVIADWRGGEIHALRLEPVSSSASKPFNLKSVSASVALALGTSPDKLRVEDMNFRPGAEMAYITISVDDGATPKPALVSVGADGKVTLVDLDKTPRTSAKIAGLPAADKKFWRDTPEAAFTVTDMEYYEGKLYVAGLSNASFASTLRVYDFPFKGPSTATSVEMYHAVHDQVETRAPIRTMAIATVNGEPSLIAAYTCTPLVTIPLKDLKDGAHIKGKTIAELGWGSAPLDMVTFDSGDGPMLLLTNSHKAADLMPIAAIAKASAEPGLSTPIKWPNEPLSGLRSTYVPMSGVVQLSDQNKEFFGALRRDHSSGDLQLVSIRKGAFLRLSDFINEYDFADFTYGPKDNFRGFHQTLRTDEGYPDLAKRAAP